MGEQKIAEQRDWRVRFSGKAEGAELARIIIGQPGRIVESEQSACM
jgi:hypothetical protein